LPEAGLGWNHEQVTPGLPILVSLPSRFRASAVLRLAPALLTLGLAGTASLGCKGSVEADAKASSSGDAEANFDTDKKRDEAWESEALPSSDSSAPAPKTSSTSSAPPASAALLGARHDLTPAGTPAPACQCLVVVAGVPTRTGLAWSGPPPQIDSKTQLVVALSSDQVKCSVEVPKASYMGYEARGSDVVIQVEGAVAGRPLTQGAIVPRPMTGGKLLIESSANLPYGKLPSGQGPCSVPF
jgi:hypothetical protein